MPILRRGLLGFGVGAAVTLALPGPERVYSFVGGWQRDWRFHECDPLHWGIVGDGVTDCAPALNHMLRTVGRAWLQYGIYRIGAPLELPVGGEITGHTALVEVAHNGPVVIIVAGDSDKPARLHGITTRNVPGFQPSAFLGGG